MTLTSEQARHYYDRFVAKQDRQGWYEDAALAWLLAHGAFDGALSLLEIGCGTGRFALRLREEAMASNAAYTGLDISPAMLAAARDRLARSNGHSNFVQGDATAMLPFASGRFDRVIAAYVLDLLSEADSTMLLAEAHRVLAPDGLLCVASLDSKSSGGLSRAIGVLWSAIQRIAPKRVGGCRPIDLRSKLDPASWRLIDHGSLKPWGVGSQALIARRI